MVDTCPTCKQRWIDLQTSVETADAIVRAGRDLLTTAKTISDMLEASGLGDSSAILKAQMTYLINALNMAEKKDG